jgi:hypothetical protein
MESQGFYFIPSGMWSVGDLGAAETATLTIDATINTVGQIRNLATITACDQHDPVTTNNTEVAMVTGLPRDLATSADIDLAEGYNLISLPLIPEDTDLDTMMTGLDYIKVSQYINDSDGMGDWFINNAGSPETSDLFIMEDGWGYWVEMNTTGVLSFPGYELAPPPPAMPKAYDMYQRWNLGGFKSMDPKMPSDYLAGIAGKYTIIYGFDNGAWFIVGTAGHEMLQPGLGYWIAVKSGESGTVFP